MTYGLSRGDLSSRRACLVLLRFILFQIATGCKALFIIDRVWCTDVDYCSHHVITNSLEMLTRRRRRMEEREDKSLLYS